MEKTEKRVSVVIPTYNRSEELVECLSCLELQIDKNRDEILIVDDGSKKVESNKVKKFIKNKKFYKYFYKKNEGPAAARNLAINKSKGKLLIFMNDDSLADGDYISNHIKFHKIHNFNEALIGRFDEYPKLINTPIMKWLVEESNLHFKYLEDRKIMPWYYFWTGNISIRKDFFTKNNLRFDEEFKVAAWEDIEFGYRAMRAGLKIYFDEKASSWHNHYFESDDIFRRFYSHGRGMYTVSKKLPRENLPMLAKSEYRYLARLLLFLTFYSGINLWIKKYLKKEDRINNLLMQYLIVGEKIKGWDYEKHKDK